MAAVVMIHAGFKLLKAGFASPDQDPSLILPPKMKRGVEDNDGADASTIEEVTGDTVVKGSIMDWSAMEDLLRHVLYTNLGWADGGGLILFTDPLFTPEVFMPRNKPFYLFMPEEACQNALSILVMEK
ncbi:hypothetical protein OPV22_009920 [Ensete ventricosum]|uniref:FAS1 domain-containing protein n=1 Tax=Ensete ventricosum TaxID=4639 RepID=A0AAV8RGZ5_ENSVE|nr:hypothetical protein OPV22_009920 [Ensete ventricosum]